MSKLHGCLLVKYFDLLFLFFDRNYLNPLVSVRDIAGSIAARNGYVPHAAIDWELTRTESSINFL